MAKLGSTVDARLLRISPYAIRAIEQGGAAMGAGYASIGASAAKAIRSYADMKKEEEKKDQAIEILTKEYAELYGEERGEEMAQVAVDVYGPVGGLTEGRSAILGVKTRKTQADQFKATEESKLAHNLTMAANTALRSQIALETLALQRKESLAKLNKDSPEYREAAARLEGVQLHLNESKLKANQATKNQDAFQKANRAMNQLLKYDLSDEKRFQFTTDVQDAFGDYYAVNPATGQPVPLETQMLGIYFEGSLGSLGSQTVSENPNNIKSAYKNLFLSELLEVTPVLDDDEKQVKGPGRKATSGKPYSGDTTTAGDELSKLVESGVLRVKKLGAFNVFQENIRAAVKNEVSVTPEQIEFYKNLDDKKKQIIDATIKHYGQTWEGLKGI